MHPPARFPRPPWTAASLCALGAVVLATALVLLLIGRRLQLGYDPAWHVFIATQESWASFLRETARTAHPPLYMLALRFSIDLLGDSLLAYRAISIAAILACVWLVGRLTATLTSNAWLAVLAAAAFGLSANAIEIGLEVRSYALALAFLLAAYAAYLDWLDRDPAEVRASTRCTFAVASSAAILTHYSAVFFLAAAVVTPAWLWLSDRRWRARLAVEARGFPFAAAVMFGVPLATAAAAYALHVRGRWFTRRFEHVPAFLWDPAGESSIRFLARNTRNLARLLIPDMGGGDAAAAALSLLLFGLIVWSIARVRGRLAMATVAVLGTMCVLNAVAGLAGRYPFGGFMRHEVFLFPFALLALAQGFETVREAAPRAWSSRALWAGGAALCVAASVALWSSRYQLRTGEMMQPQIDAFREVFGKPSAVLTDRFNFIALYTHFRSWTWNPLDPDGADGMLEMWEVARPPERFRVCRSAQWQLDLSQLPAYADAAACLDGFDRVAVFRPQQHRISPVWNIRETPRLARDLSARLGLIPLEVRIENDDAYLLLRARDGSRP